MSATELRGKQFTDASRCTINPMRTLVAILALSLFTTIGPANAETEAQPTFAHALFMEGLETPMVLVGSAERSYQFVTYYDCAIYAPNGIKTVNRIVSEVTPKRLELVWRIPSLSRERIETYWREQIKGSFQDEGALLRNWQRVEQFADKVGGLTRGQRLAFNFLPDAGTRVYLDDEPLTTLVGVEFNRAVWDIWLQEKGQPGTWRDFRSKLLGIDQ